MSRSRSPARTCLGALALAAFGLLPCIHAHLTWADDDLPNASEFFDEFDTNGDGKVTSEEFGREAQVYKLLDKNHDGVITPSDLGLPADYKPDPKRRKRGPGGLAGSPAARDGEGKRAQRARRAEAMRKKLIAMDVNQDGKVSREEWKGQPAIFDRLDRNKDGVLDKADRPRGKEGRRMGPDRAPRADGPEGKRREDETPEELEARATEQFRKIDKNADGLVTAAEAPNPRLVEAADANEDGAVTVEEFVSFVKNRGKRGAGKGRNKKDGRRKGRISGGMLRRWDRDGDGKVSRDEFPGRDAIFERADVDKDGFLTEADLAAARAKKAPGGKQGAPKPGPEKPRAKDARDLLQAHDTDGDGRLNRAEFPGTNAEWRALDKDGDGFLTRAELGK